MVGEVGWKTKLGEVQESSGNKGYEKLAYAANSRERFEHAYLLTKFRFGSDITDALKHIGCNTVDRKLRISLIIHFFFRKSCDPEYIYSLCTLALFQFSPMLRFEELVHVAHLL